MSRFVSLLPEMANNQVQILCYCTVTQYLFLKFFCPNYFKVFVYIFHIKSSFQLFTFPQRSSLFYTQSFSFFIICDTTPMCENFLFYVCLCVHVCRCSGECVSVCVSAGPPLHRHPTPFTPLTAASTWGSCSWEGLRSSSMMSKPTHCCVTQSSVSLLATAPGEWIVSCAKQKSRKYRKSLSILRKHMKDCPESRLGVSYS